MSKTTNLFSDYVFNLFCDEFENLKDAVNQRIGKDKYGVISFEDAAIKYGRKPICPKCGSASFCEDGFTDSGHRRYKCAKCRCRYTLLSNSIFNSAKLPLFKLLKYIGLMSYNVPLELMCEIFGYYSEYCGVMVKEDI